MEPKDAGGVGPEDGVRPASWARRLDVRAGLLAFGVLLAVELGVVRSGYLWERVPGTMLGAFLGVEREVLAGAETPAIVFFGSSRMRDAVAPRALEGELGLRRGAVMNLGLTGGTPYEARLLYERHPTVLRGAQVVVVGLEVWYWNRGTPRDEVERHFATFSDRRAWFEERRKLGDLVGGVWRTTELGDPLGRFAQSLYAGVKPVVFDEGRMVWRKAAEVRDVGPEDVDVVEPLEHHMQGLAEGPVHEASIRALVEAARSAGARVLLTHVPVRVPYYDELTRRYPGMESYVRGRAEVLARELGAELAWYARGEAVGIPDDRFYDYGHLTEDGVRRMHEVWKQQIELPPEARGVPGTSGGAVDE